MENFIIPLLITIVILVVIFLLLREVNCWYWKINDRVKLQKEILNELRSITVILSKNFNISKNSINVAISPDQESAAIDCPYCKAKKSVIEKLNNYFCKSCERTWSIK
jgi:hypothetical protein